MNTEDCNILDLSYLEVTFKGNKLIINKILQSFLDITPQLLVDLMSNANHDDWGEVKMIAHKVKSSFNAIGASKIGKILEEIELTAISSNKLNALSLINDVKELSEQAFREAEDQINR